MPRGSKIGLGDEDHIRAHLTEEKIALFAKQRAGLIGNSDNRTQMIGEEIVSGRTCSARTGGHGNGLTGEGIVFPDRPGHSVVLHFICAAEEVIGCQGTAAVNIHLLNSRTVAVVGEGTKGSVGDVVFLPAGNFSERA